MLDLARVKKSPLRGASLKKKPLLSRRGKGITVVTVRNVKRLRPLEFFSSQSCCCIGRHCFTRVRGHNLVLFSSFLRRAGIMPIVRWSRRARKGNPRRKFFPEVVLHITNLNGFESFVSDDDDVEVLEAPSRPATYVTYSWEPFMCLNYLSLSGRVRASPSFTRARWITRNREFILDASVYAC